MLALNLAHEIVRGEKDTKALAAQKAGKNPSLTDHLFEIEAATRRRRSRCLRPAVSGATTCRRNGLRAQ